MEKTKDGKKYLNAEEAIALLPESELIHTFYSTGMCLVGGDWDRADILQKLTEVDRIEIAGDSARSMRHLMKCCYSEKLIVHKQNLRN